MASAYAEHVDLYLSELEGASPGLSVECAECLSVFDGVDADSAADMAALRSQIEEVGDEGYFSRYPCEICDSPLGGQRYRWHAWATDKSVDPKGELVHGDCCTDCLVYLANGDEPGDDHYLLAPDDLDDFDEA